MTIHVIKTCVASATTEDMYNIELTAIELEYLRCALNLYAVNAIPSFNNQDHIAFADKCAVIINETLVANGD
jgi:hypothetical protein